MGSIDSICVSHCPIPIPFLFSPPQLHISLTTRLQGLFTLADLDPRVPYKQ